jgi:hypothetical protein
VAHARNYGWFVPWFTVSSCITDGHVMRMKLDSDKHHDSLGADGLFRTTTHWSVVLAAKTGDESEIFQSTGTIVPRLLVSALRLCSATRVECGRLPRI